MKKSKNEASFPKTIESQERFANYIMRGNYPDFFFKSGNTKSKKMKLIAQLELLN